MLEDKLLILKFNRGSREALQAIYEKYKDDLVTLAAALLMSLSGNGRKSLAFRRRL